MTNESEKRHQIKKYFLKYPKWTIHFLWIGLIAYLFEPTAIIISGFSIAVFFWWIKKPTDQEFDLMVQQDIHNIQEESLTKCQLDDSMLVRESIIITSPKFWNVSGASIGLKKGKDKIIRFMPMDITIIHFTQDFLSAYQGTLDLSTGKALNSQTYEYSYSKIEGITTTSESITLDKRNLHPKFGKLFLKLEDHVVDGRLQLNQAEHLKLTTVGGNSIKVVLKDPVLIEAAGGGDIPTHLADKAISAVRRMVREKSGSY